MHGLVNKGLQRFLTDTYGEDVWANIAKATRLPQEGFEALLTYDISMTHGVLNEAAHQLGKSSDMLLEDLGTYLVSAAKMEPIRRLLRFGGIDFPDFVMSLDELPERARLAVPNLILPELDIRELGPEEYEIFVRSDFGCFGRVLAGMLRAMADDYGCLSLIEWAATNARDETVTVKVLDGAHAEAKEFVLSAEAAQ